MQINNHGYKRDTNKEIGLTQKDNRCLTIKTLLIQPLVQFTEQGQHHRTCDILCQGSHFVTLMNELDL